MLYLFHSAAATWFEHIPLSIQWLVQEAVVCYATSPQLGSQVSGALWIHWNVEWVLNLAGLDHRSQKKQHFEH